MPLPLKLIRFALEQVPSFSSFLPYLAYDEEHELYLLAKDTNLTQMAWGFAFECVPHPGPGQQQATLIKGIYNQPWPAGTTIQINAFALPTETFPMLQEYVRLRQPGIYRNMGRTRVQTLCDRLLSGHNETQVAPLRDTTIVVSVTVPVAPTSRLSSASLSRALLSAIGIRHTQTVADITTQMPSLMRFKTSVQQLLSQGNMAPRPLPPPRLLTLLSPILNPGHSFRPCAHYEPDREIRRQLIAADTRITPTEQGALIDGYHFRSISPLRFPQEIRIDQTFGLSGDAFNNSQQIPTPFLLTLNSVLYERADVAQAFQRRHTITAQQGQGPLARMIPRLALKLEQYDITAKALEQGHIQVSAYPHLLTWGEDAEQTENAAAAVEALWRTHGFEPQRDGPVTLNMLKESLPMALSGNPAYLQRDLARAKTILDSNTASLSPIGGDWKGTGRPIVPLVSRRGQLCALDLFHNPYGNFNCIIAGKSGGGKSFFTNDLLCGLLGAGAQVWIIDKGKSYERLVQTLKGDYLLFKASEPICLNPFSAIDPSQLEEWLTRLKALVAQMADPTRQLGAYEDSVIGQAIQEAHASNGRDTTISAVANQLRVHDDPRCRDLAQMLYPYTAKGEFGRFFEGTATINLLRSPLLLLELEELSTKPALQSVIFLDLVLAVQAAMEGGDRSQQRVIAIDEAWQFMRSPQAATFVVEIYRRFRKYNGAAITITQEINDMLTLEAGASILANSDMRILFPHKYEGLTDPRIGLNEYELALMHSLNMASGKYSELYIKHATGGGVYRHIVDPYAYWLYTTNADEVARIQALQNQGLTIEEAIAQLTSRNQNTKSSKSTAAVNAILGPSQ